jgi:hypothetical protein
MKKFEEKVPTAGEWSQIQREIITNFSVVYAGGAMASDAGIFPLSREQIGEAVIRCCEAALGEVPDAQSSLKKALLQLSIRLKDRQVIAEGNAIAKKRKASGFAGWFDNKNRDHRYVIRASEFVDWFNTPCSAWKCWIGSMSVDSFRVRGPFRRLVGELLGPNGKCCGRTEAAPLD